MGLLLTEQLLPHRVLTQRDTAHRHNDCSQTETLLTDRDTARTEQLLTQNTAHTEHCSQRESAQRATVHKERLLTRRGCSQQSLLVNSRYLSL